MPNIAVKLNAPKVGAPLTSTLADTGGSRTMHEIFVAIDQYAVAYSRLEALQRSCTKEIPIGDQKTGVIAEFYGRIYATHRFPKATFEFGSTSEYAWDIKVLQTGQPEIKVQIKAVSAHSKTSRMSPIHPGWHQLWLMRIDKHLQPHALWVVDAQQAAWSTKLQKNLTMPKLGKAQSGSAVLRGATDETEQFIAIFDRLRDKATQCR